MTQELFYRRILIKLSGEAFLDKDDDNVCFIDTIIEDLVELVELKVQVALVVGGGNFLRGSQLSKKGFGRVTCDQVGMLATIMNGLLLQDSLRAKGVPTNLMSAIPVTGIVREYNNTKAMNALSKGKVLIFSAGVGQALFSTDSAASLRAIEIGADVVLKATKVDGVYSTDPFKDKNAVLLKKLSYQDTIEKQLGVMDITAIALCREYAMPVRVFNMYNKGILRRIVLGFDEGTLISGENHD